MCHGMEGRIGEGDGVLVPQEKGQGSTVRDQRGQKQRRPQRGWQRGLPRPEVAKKQVDWR